MPVTTVTILQCDECAEVVGDHETTYVSASVYGAVFHRQCWESVGGPRVARLLGLDDITIRRTNDGSFVEKAWGAR